MFYICPLFNTAQMMKTNLYSLARLLQLKIFYQKAFKLILPAFLLFWSVGVIAQTTSVTYTFSGANGTEIITGTIDTNLSFVTAKGTSAQSPSFFTATPAAVRIYSDRNTGDGNSFTITAAAGYEITGLTFTAVAAANAPVVTYSADGAAFATMPKTVETYTGTGLTATALTFKNAHTGGSSNIQLRIASFTVTYKVTGKTSNGTGGGDWNIDETWSPSGIPTATDDVTILPNDIVFTTSALTRTGTTTVNGSFQLNIGGSASGTDFKYGSSGTLIFNKSSSAYVVNSGDVFWPSSSGPFNVNVLQGGLTLNSTNKTVPGNFSIKGTSAVLAGVFLNSGSTISFNGNTTIYEYAYIANAPSYGPSSTLIYSTGSIFNRGLEWSANAAGLGYPNNVQVSGNTTINYPSTGTGLFNQPLGIAKNLTIDTGSSLFMDYGLNDNKAGRLTIGGDFVNEGNLTLGDAFGGDLYLAGNWKKTGTFNPNNRAVFFNGSANQTIRGTTTFDYLTIDNSAGVTLANNVVNNLTLDFLNGKLTLGANDLTIGSGGTITNATIAKYVVTNSTGQLKRTVGGTDTVFPVGNSAYNPITFKNSGTSDIYGVRVADVAPAAANPSKTVTRQWITTEAVANGSNLSVVAQYNSGETGGNFAGGNPYIGFYNGSSWSQVGANITGSFLATSTANSKPSDLTSGTQYFAIGKDNAFITTATILVLKSVPATGTVATNLATFTVEAQDSFNDVVTNFTGNIVIAETTGSANMSGSTTIPAVAGVASFNDIQFDAADTYTITTTSGSLTSATSGNIVISPNPTTAYFRSKNATGNWNVPGSWESSNDGSTAWVTSSVAPTSAANTITIRNGHTITIAASGITVDQLVIGTGGILDVTKSFTVNDGMGDDVIIQSGGTLKYSTSSTYAAFGSGSPTISNETGGTILVTAGGIMGNIAPQNNYIYKDASILEWGLNSPFSASNVIYFPNVNPTTIPIFRVSNSIGGTVGGGSNTVINGVFEVTGSVGIGGSGDKTFRNGIRGSGTVKQEVGSGYLILGDGNNVPTIDGSVTLNVLSAGLQLPNGANVPTNANAKITSGAENNTINRIGGFVTIDGILDITNMRISNPLSGGIIVNGTLRTANTGGLYGDGSAIVGNTLTFNTNSTIEYYATANQVISSTPNYYNITFSGAGTKTPQNATSVNTLGTVKITGTPIVDFTNWNLASTGLNGTKFIMDGGKFIVGTGGTQPRPGGTYTMTGGAIEFTGDSNTDIRITPNYNDIIISGKNKKPGATGFIINNILSVTSAGNLTIPDVLDNNTPYVVTAKKGVQVAAGGQLIFKNNAQLMQDADAVNIGNITMKRNSPMKKNNYTYWSSPVSGQKLQDFSPTTSSTRFYEYIESTNLFKIVPWTNDFIPGKGYAIMAPSSYTLSAPTIFEASFNGTPTNSNKIGSNDLEFPLSLSTGSDQGYNMIGNPYPSNIDFDLLYGLNKTSVYQTAYFWTNVDPNRPASTNGTVGYSGNAYAIYNGTGGVSSAGTGTGGTSAVPNKIIKVGQGFIIKAKPGANGAKLKFDNTIRDTTGTGTFFSKEGATAKDRFWLNLISPSLNINTILIGYIPTATNDFEWDYDATLFSVASDSFYSVLDGEKLGIQGRLHPLNTKDIVELGTKHFEQGNYTISLGVKEGIFAADQNIYLKDKITGIVTNLTAGNYTFSTNATENATRFEIIYEPQSVLAAGVTNKGKVMVYRDGDFFILESKNTLLREVELFDISGKLILKANPEKEKYKIDASNFSKGVYLFKINTGKEIIVKRIIR